MGVLCTFYGSHAENNYSKVKGVLVSQKLMPSLATLTSVLPRPRAGVTQIKVPCS